jgi:uncharacterized damage-inducible protein DinB
MTADQVRTHIHYTGWASRKLLDEARKLDEEQLSRNLSVSHHSILETLAHIHFGDRVWFSRMVDPGIEVYRTDNLLPLARLEEEWTAIQKRWEEWAGSLTDADVSRMVSYTNPKGDAEQMPVWKIVLHVVNHGTLHRGQVMAMLRQLGIRPPATDLMAYYRQQK